MLVEDETRSLRHCLVMSDNPGDHFQRTIASLVMASETSVRLRNCVSANPSLGALTLFEFLSNPAKTRINLLRFRSLGQKTARELIALAKVAASKPPAADITLVEESRSRRAFKSLMSLLSPISFPSDLLAVELSSRLRNVLQALCEIQSQRSRPNTSIAGCDLGAVISDWPECRARLRKQVNVGPSTITELEAIIERIVSRTLELLSGIKEDMGLTMEALQDERLDPIFHQVLIDAARSATNEPLMDLATLLHGTDPRLRLTPLEHIQDTVARLPEKERETIIRRFGLDGERPRTLEQIASRFHVTRERVRQVEGKALGRLRIGANRSAFKRILNAESQAVWDLLADRTDIIMPADLQDRRDEMSPHFLLAIEVCHGRINDWLDAYGQVALGGWLQPGSDLVALQDNTARIACWGRNAPEPVPLTTACRQARVQARDFLNAARLQPEVKLFEGYVCLGVLGSQARRTCRLHSLAVSLGGGRSFDVCTLRDAYAVKYPDDVVSARVILLQLVRAPHLFLRLFDWIWISLSLELDHSAGAIDHIPFSRVPMLARSEFEAGSIGDWLQEVLANNGPSRTVDLRQLAGVAFSNSISQSSIGAVLQSNPDFVRIAPGVYGLQSAVIAWSGPNSACPALLNETQCRYYALARKSGDPIAIYPGWSSAVEMSLCRWASSNASDDIYRSIVAVAEPSMWPVSPDEVDEWLAKKLVYGSYRLPASDLPRDMRLPPADSFLSSAAYLATTGSIAWTTVNRTSQRRIDSIKAASTLALLVRFGMASPPLHWQERHHATPKAVVAVTASLSDLSRTGALSWDDGYLRALRTEPTSVGLTIYPSEAVETMLSGGEAMAERGGIRAQGQSAPDVETLFGSEDWGALFNTA